MMEDADIASTFTMPTLKIAEENHVLTQVPQPFERAQLLERDQTETSTQNDNTEELLNEQRETVDTPQVQERSQPDRIQVTEVVCI